MPEDHAHIPGFMARMLVMLLAAIMNATPGYSSPCNDSIPGSYTRIAADLCSKGQLKEAIAASDSSIASAVESADPFTWYVRGYILKEFYKHYESDNFQSPAREQAIDAFLKAKNLGYLNENNDKALAYLMTTCYNNALVLAASLSEESDELLSKKIFSRYLEVARSLNETEKIRRASGEYHKTCAQSYYRKWMEAPCNTHFMDLAISETKLALTCQPDDCDLLYNLAVIDYSYVYHCSGEESFSADTKLGILKRSADLLFDAEKVCVDNVNIVNAMINVQRFLENETLVRQYESKRNDLMKLSE